MPIIVEHRAPAAVSGRLAYYIGAAQRAERERDRALARAQEEETRAFEREMLYRRAALLQEQEERSQRFELYREGMRRQEAEQVRAEALGARREERTFQTQEREAGQTFQTGLEEGRSQQAVDVIRAKGEEERTTYTAQQEADRAKLLNDIQAVQGDETLTPEEKQYALDQLQGKLYGIKPMQPKEDSPWAQGQDVGDIWTDGSGIVVTRQHDGDIRPLSQPEKPTAYDLGDLAKLYDQAVKALTTVDPTTEQEVPPSEAAVEAYVGRILKRYQALVPQEQTRKPQATPSPPQEEFTRPSEEEQWWARAQERAIDQPEKPTPQPPPNLKQLWAEKVTAEQRPQVESTLRMLAQNVRSAEPGPERHMAWEKLRDYVWAVFGVTPEQLMGGR